MPSAHDASYKLLFSAPELVRDLVLGFIPDAWLHSLDYATLEKMPGSYISDDMRHRADDVVWRVKVGGEWIYLYILIEFQSKVDPWMAVRMMSYVGLLYQDLIKAKQVLPQRKLPPVLPIVLYNGERRWRAPVTLTELLPKVPSFLAPLQPQMRYVLIDEGAVPSETLARLPRNLAATIFRLEQPQTPAAIQAIVTELEASTRSEEFTTVRRLVAIWIRAALHRNRKCPIVLPELDDLQELNIMLSQRIEQWAEGYIATGRMEGEARVLARLLARRFGVLPEWAEARLNAAGEAELLRWSEAVLDASSLGEVLGPSPTDH